MRYNKRYGKDKPAEQVEGVNPDRWKNFSQSGDKGGKDRAPKDKGGKEGGGKDTRDFNPKKKVDPRTIRSGAAHASAPRASQAIVESTGKKTKFE